MKGPIEFLVRTKSFFKLKLREISTLLHQPSTRRAPLSFSPPHAIENDAANHTDFFSHAKNDNKEYNFL